MKKLLGVLCLFGVAVGGFVHVVSSGGARGATAGAGIGRTGDPAAGAEDPASAGFGRAEAPAPAGLPSLVAAPAPAREELRVEPLAGLLSGHQPGAAALISWTPVLPETEGARYANSIDHERLRQVTVSTGCAAGGGFRFPSIPEGAADGDSVVWITQAGGEARSVLLGPVEVGWRWPDAEPAPAREPVRVVVRRSGEPVSGASIRHTLSFWDPGQTEDDKRSRRVFLRDLETGPDGSAAIVPGSGENVLLAVHGGERSYLWTGTPEKEPEKEIVLELLPTVEVSGRVLTDDPELELDQVRYHVAYASADDLSDLVFAGASLGVRADGRFGPDLWPRGEARRLAVYVSGGEVVTAHAEVPNPVAGASATVEVTTTRGYPFEVTVADRAGEPLQGAMVRAAHWNGTEWLSQRQELTGEDGRASLRAPRGQLWVEVQKPGFTTLTFDDPRTLVPSTAGPLAVVLRPAGVIEGFVHHASEPVERFVLVGWNEDKSYYLERQLEDEEGAFELEGVPKGEPVHLFAFSERLPQSDTAVIVLGDEPREVELELPAPCKARGRVIDSVTRASVPAATIQHLTSGMDGLATYRGRATKVREDGSFELDGFFPGRGGFACMAEGYETLYYSTREDEDEVIDVGLLALNPLSLLEVQVREPGVSDFAGYHAWNRHNDDKTPIPVASDGTLAIPSRTGLYEVNVARPDGTVTWVSGIVLPGEHRKVEVELGRGIELAVALEELPAGVESWTASAFSSVRDTERRTQGRWSAERGAFLLRGIDPGDVVLELRNGERDLVTQRSLRLTDLAHQTVELALAGEKRRLRLVDGRGKPWAARPVVVSLEDASGWYAKRETDAAGELEIGPLEPRRVVLSAKLANESIAYGVPVELEPDSKRTTTVVLDVGPRSLLRLTEEGQPCGAVDVAYKHDLGPRFLEFGYISDESGLIRGPFLGPGTYTVRVNHARYWPTRYQVTSRDSTDPLPLELFSRAALAITVTTTAGEPAGGAELALEHAELGQSAAAWLAAGLIVSPTSLAADHTGRLVLEGIPRGSYSWTCISPSGMRASGSLHLSPGETSTLAVRLADAATGW